LKITVTVAVQIGGGECVDHIQFRSIQHQTVLAENLDHKTVKIYDPELVSVFRVSLLQCVNFFLEFDVFFVGHARISEVGIEIYCSYVWNIIFALCVDGVGS
jgi:hypothetical protein